MVEPTVEEQERFSSAGSEAGSSTSARSVSLPQRCWGFVAAGKRHWESTAEVLPASPSCALGEREGVGKRVAPKSGWAAENFGCFIGDFYTLVQIDEPSMPCELMGFFLFIIY